MSNYHPSDNTLVEFSAGNLDWALSIIVSAHLQFCPECKRKIQELNAIGGSTLLQTEAVDVNDNCFTEVMNKINLTPQNIGGDTTTLGHSATSPPQESDRAQALPKVVQKLIPSDKPLKWSAVAPHLKSAKLETGQHKYEVCFHKIKKGGKVAEHDHRGLEVTLVLEGSFSDAEGNYSPGDYLVREPGDVHRPMAAQDQDCLCLSVVEAPVKVTGLLGKIINPFLSISPK